MSRQDAGSSGRPSVARRTTGTSAQVLDVAARTVRVGDTQITALLDVLLDFPMPLAQVFPGPSPADWAPYRARYPEAFGEGDVWRYFVHCYLVRSRGRTLLVDTGCGAARLAFPAFLGLEGRLERLLREQGVESEEIEVVVITHVHPDHVGGSVTEADGEIRPAFPGARYLLHRADWETWTRPEVKEAFPIPFVDDTVARLEAAGVLELHAGELALTDEISLLHTPGHTPGSVSVLIVSAGERALLCGDAWLHPAQVTEPELPSAFDMDAEVAAGTRRTLAERVEAEGMTIGVCHFPAPFGQLVRLEGRRHWIPL
jgi:glyoxylase-like metal-dependent hydrolase (beta-lactamase superfamily II)